MSPTEQVWTDYHSNLRGFIQSRVNDASIVDDILQDVFLKIHSRIDTLKDSSKIQSWIYQITRNTIIDYYRAHKKTEELPPSLADSELDQGGSVYQDLQQCVLLMIERLPVHYREAMIQAEIEGLTQREVSIGQGISLSGAKARIQRGRVMMKDLLLRCCKFELDHQGRIITYHKQQSSCGCGSC